MNSAGSFFLFKQFSFRSNPYIDVIFGIWYYDTGIAAFAVLAMDCIKKKNKLYECFETENARRKIFLRAFADAVTMAGKRPIWRTGV